MTLQEIIKNKVLVLDGAMGTMIQKYKLTEQDFRGERFKDIPGLLQGNNDILSLTRPDIIREIHIRYLEAGADIIETNTFSSQCISMADYHVEAYCRDINLAACQIARSLADEYTTRNPEKPRFVAGSVGPTNKTCSMSPDVNNPAYRALTFNELAMAYQEQMEVLIEGGVDALLIETIFLGSFMLDKKKNVDNYAENVDKLLENKAKEKQLVKKEEKNTEKTLNVTPSNIHEDEYLTQLIKIRVNNCFVNAKKEYLLEAKEVWSIL